MSIKTIVIGAVLALAAVGGAAFGGMQFHEHAQTRSALKSANADLQKARTDLNATRNELQSLQKQFAEQQVALNQLQAEMTNARAFVEAEKAVSQRLREELAKQKEEFATALKAASSRSSQGRLAPPSVVDSPPPRVVQGRRGTQAANPGAAQ